MKKLNKSNHKHTYITDLLGGNPHCKICGQIKNGTGTYHNPRIWGKYL